MTDCLPRAGELPEMAFSLVWLHDVLLDAGLKVAPVDGWESRGIGDVGRTFGVLCHHTAGLQTGNMPSLETLIHGRPDLNGPLAQLGLGRDGTYYLIAAGRCNHAGMGSWRGINTGNTNFIGVEAENTGLRDDAPWPAVQVDAYHRGVAAILKHSGLGAESCAGHKEWAPARKEDPALDMQEFRGAVALILAGAAPPLVLIPAREAAENGGAEPGRVPLRRGDRGSLVSRMQGILRVEADGVFGGGTEAAVRRFQRGRGLVPDGIVGPRTWGALDGVLG